jgi:hypothetical protein
MTTHVMCMAFSAPRHTSALPFYKLPPLQEMPLETHIQEETRFTGTFGVTSTSKITP